MIMIVIIIISLFHLKEKWVPHMDNNNIKKYMYKRLSFKSAQQHTGKVKARHYSAKEKKLCFSIISNFIGLVVRSLLKNVDKH